MSFFFIFSLYAVHRSLHSFPTRRSSDLPLLHLDAARGQRPGLHGEQSDLDRLALRERRGRRQRHRGRATEERTTRDPQRDRKSTRLNSSHLGISYAVFCLKKKKQEDNKK